MSSIRLSLSSSRMTIFSPKSVGSTETRKSRSLIRPEILVLILMRPSCGSRFSAMSSFAMILMRLVIASLQLQRRVHHLVEDAVDAVADPVLLLVGLDVDVGGAALDGVGEDDVDQLDDRRLSDSSSSAARSSSSSSSRTSRSRAATPRDRSSMTFFSSMAWVEP